MQPLPQPPPSPLLLQHSRTNLSDLKTQIAKQLGAERAQHYFSYLNRLLSQKLSKSEFNNLCLLTLGRKNLSLHNELVRSILRNACQAKAPPSVNHVKDLQKPTTSLLKKTPQVDDGFSSLWNPNPSMPVSSNGDILPPSPCKFRTEAQNQHVNDHPSPLGPNGRAELAPRQSAVSYDKIVISENGDLSPSSFKRLQHQRDGGMEQLAKRPRLDKSLRHGSVHGKDLVSVATVEDRDRLDDWDSSRGPLQAPFGIPFCSASIGGTRRCLLSTASASSSDFSSSYGCGELCHTEILKKRLEKIAEAQGLGGVTINCANLLNNSVDVYLKQLIRSCVELVGARTRHELIKQSVSRLQSYRKPINGTLVRNIIQVQSVGGPSEGLHELNNCCSISMQDFRVAMWLNPQQLGEDWPLLIEKICVCSYAE